MRVDLRLLCALFVAFLAPCLNLQAQTKFPETSGDGGRKDLKEAASARDAQQELESPDGVALQLLPDGGFRIYGRGSGTYDFEGLKSGVTKSIKIREEIVAQKSHVVLLGSRTVATWFSDNSTHFNVVLASEIK